MTQQHLPLRRQVHGGAACWLAAWHDRVAAHRLDRAMSQQVICANQQTRMRWANGAGWTREIHAEPIAPTTVGLAAAANATAANAAPSWWWRLSIAEIEAAAPFSHLPGIEREVLLVHGQGLRLSASPGTDAEAAGATVEVLPPQGRHRFAGEQPLIGTPLDGTCHVLNLMWRRTHCDATLWRRPLVGSMLLFLDAGEHGFVHVLAGQAEVGTDAGSVNLGMGDTLVLASTHERMRVALDGAGEVVLARLVRTARG